MKFESLPSKRELPPFVRRSDALREARQLIAARNRDRLEAEKQLSAQRGRADKMAVAFALLAYKKRGSPEPLAQSLAALLTDLGIETVTYAGTALSAELETSADIVEWLPALENAEALVEEAIEPEIRCDGRILHRAKLSCRMAAPEPEPAAAPEPSPAEPEPAGEAAPQTDAPPAAEAAGEPPEKAEPGLLERLRAFFARLFAPESPSVPPGDSQNTVHKEGSGSNEDQ